jgi:hypothetical protein
MQTPSEHARGLACFLHLPHGSMYISLHIFSTMLDSAIDLGAGSDCMHEQTTFSARLSACAEGHMASRNTAARECEG